MFLDNYILQYHISVLVLPTHHCVDKCNKSVILCQSVFTVSNVYNMSGCVVTSTSGCNKDAFDSSSVLELQALIKFSSLLYFPY